MTTDQALAWMAQWRSGAEALDEQLILRELTPLLELKGTPETARRLRAILEKALPSTR